MDLIYIALIFHNAVIPLYVINYNAVLLLSSLFIGALALCTMQMTCSQLTSDECEMRY